jgi:hypothetical protein
MTMMTTPEGDVRQPLHQRAWDLLRQMRSELLDAELISREEYAWLLAEAPGASDKPGAGSPAPRRLETYDEHAVRLKDAEGQVKALSKALSDPDGVNKLIAERDEARQYRRDEFDLRMAAEARVKELEAKLTAHPAPSGWQQRIAESRLALAVEAERHLASIWTSLPLGAQANAMRLNQAGLDPVYRALRELGGQNAVDALSPSTARLDAALIAEACALLIELESRAEGCYEDAMETSQTGEKADEQREMKRYHFYARCENVFGRLVDALPPAPDAKDAIPPEPEGATAKENR